MQIRIQPTPRMRQVLNNEHAHQTNHCPASGSLGRPMRIVIDMQGAQTASRFRGIGRYTLSFAQAIVRNRGEHDIILALNGFFADTIEPIRAEFDGTLSQDDIRIWYAPGPVARERHQNVTRHEMAELIREAFLASLQPDIIHICSLFEGFGDDSVLSIGQLDQNTPVTAALHDLIPLLHADQYLKPNSRFEPYYFRQLDYLKKASRLLSISEFSRQEGIEHLNLEDQRVVNVSLAIGPEFQPLELSEATRDALGKKFNITRPYILSTGGADERKNLPRLIQAYATLPHPLRQGHQLVFSGKMPESEIKRLRGIGRRAGLKRTELCFTGYVTDDELIELYNRCQFFVFPSWHEGFGLPALEAMACGAPVIGANNTSLSEVIGLERALFDPLDLESIGQKLHQCMVDETFREELRAHGLQQAKRFSWDETAKQAIAVWEELRSNGLDPYSNIPSMRARLIKSLVSYLQESNEAMLVDLSACIARNHPNESLSNP